MNRKDAIEVARNSLEEYLRLNGIDIGANGRKNFRCLNPEHPDIHPSMNYNRDSQRVICSACHKSYNIFDLIGIDYQTDNFNEQFEKAAEILGIYYDKEDNKGFDWSGTLTGKPSRAHSKKPAEPSRSETKPEPKQESSAGPKTEDYTAFFKEANGNLDKTDYLRQRGISRATADKFMLGYVEKWQHPKGPSSETGPAIIIPLGKDAYKARYINPLNSDKNNRYRAVNEKIFNIDILGTATEPIFIVEGELDAISIIQAGGEAIALGSTNKVTAFADAVKQIKPQQPLIIALDNDRAGIDGNKKLCELLQTAELKAAGIKACNLAAKFLNTYKDANEYLQADRAEFERSISLAKEIAEYPEALAQITYEENNQASEYIERMRAELEAELKEPELSTGFKGLDQIINGGLYPGLYFIGAVSSLGKTTLALQIADSIAKQGRDCLIISLEMAKRELIAKSISRLTAEYSIKTKGDIKSLAHSTADIMNLKRQRGYYNEAGLWQEYTEQKKATIAATIDTAFNRYSEYAKHIFIYEGIGDITPKNIREKIQEHIGIYGKPPIVIVDYLQILQGENSRDTDKTKTDKNVTELKRLSRDYKTPIIAVSSVNRSSYNEPISMESFKESGGIEFSSDILIGLQYEGMDYDYINKESDKDRLKRLAELREDNREKARTGEGQLIELKILKNRNGRPGTIRLEFYPIYNYYKEIAPKPKQEKITII